jgi:signal transduction histidine kinase
MNASESKSPPPAGDGSSRDRHKHIEQWISDHPEHQEQFLLMEKMAALGQLVAGITHEINTPLGAMISNNDSIKRAVEKLASSLPGPGRVVSEEERRAVNELINTITDMSQVSRLAGARILKIVDGLRIYSRRDEVDPEPVDIHGGLDSTLVLVKHQFKNRIEVHQNYGDIPNVTCYPNQLNQVFMNILVNAGQAIGDKGEIFVRTERLDDQVLIEIRDTGKGIAEESLDCIFDPGYTTKEGSLGTGLGLTIVKQIIERHHGRIEVDSEVGTGTTIRIILPIEPA